MKNKKVLIIFVIMVLAIGMLAGCENGEVEDNEEPVVEEEVDDRLDEPGQEIRSGRLNLYSDDDEARWQLESELIRQLERTGELELEPVEVEAFLADGDEFSEIMAYWLESDAGLYREEEGLLELLGSARLESDRYIFISENITWDQKTNMISSEGEIEIRTDNFTARGGSFDATGDLETLIIYRSQENSARVIWEAEEDDELDDF